MYDCEECLTCTKNKPESCDSGRFKGICDEVAIAHHLKEKADHESNMFFFRLHGGKMGRGDN